MKIFDFLTRTVLNGVAFETGVGMGTAIAIIDRGNLVKSNLGSQEPFLQKQDITVSDFVALATVFEVPASELIKKIEVANIELREKLKGIYPEFNGYIIDELALAAIDDTQRDNLHVKHSLQNLRTCDEYVKAGIDRLVEYCEVRYPSTRTVAGNAPSTEGEFRKSIG